MIEVTDQIDRKLILDIIPKRIVSLVPSQTELLVDLGLEEYIVGVTKFCVHPLHLKKTKTIVGGTKDIKIDKIKSLQPDIILCNKEENTQDIVDDCVAICLVHVSDIYNIEDCLELIDQYGDLFSIKEKATEVIEEIQIRQKDFQKSIQKSESKKVAYFIWRNPWMISASNTYIDYMLKLNKFENVFGELKRYPEITLEILKEHNPELVLLSSEPYPFKKAHIEDIHEILPDAKVLLVNGEAFSWYGSHVTKAFEDFKKLHADIEKLK